MDSSSQVTVSTAAPLQITVSAATPSQVTVSAAAPSQVTVSADVPVLESASSVAPRLKSANVPNPVILNDDQRFLLYFIMGAYFGPDLKGEPKKSVFQRMAEGLPPYTLDQVAGSHMKMVEVERVYYYVLQKADQSLAVKFPLLDEFLRGTLNSGCESTASHPQFPDLFPPEMHPHSKFRNRYKIIGNIVFINNPEISYLKPEDIERFKRLTGVEDLLLSRDATRFHPQQDGSKLYNVPIKEAESHGESSPSLLSNTSRRKRRIDDTIKSKEQKVHDDTPLDSKPQADPTMINNANYLEGADPTLLFLPSRPTKQEWAAMTAASKTGVVLTGSAAMGNAGSVIGLVDIGECEDSYMFRVVLTGVNRDESKLLMMTSNL